MFPGKTNRCGPSYRIAGYSKLVDADLSSRSKGIHAAAGERQRHARKDDGGVFHREEQPGLAQRNLSLKQAADGVNSPSVQ